MRIEFREAKSLITKSKIQGIDYVVNTYTGCQHGCVYCYAEFMIRFTGHKGEKWSEFLDVKTFDFNKIKPQKYDGKTLLFSSVTDPYIPLEKKYENTRKILENLIGTKANITILTKSKLVTRDIDLFKQFKNIEIGISMSTLDENFSKIVERAASKPLERLEALETVHKAGLKTYVFISPFFPLITNYKKIVKVARDYTDSFRFENLNFRPHNYPRIMKIIDENYPNFLSTYKELRNDRTYWELLANEIDKFCSKNLLNYKIEFHHGGFSKS